MNVKHENKTLYCTEEFPHSLSSISNAQVWRVEKHTSLPSEQEVTSNVIERELSPI